MAKDNELVSGAREITRDVCTLGFPPPVYGEDLETIEATVQEVIERVVETGADKLLQDLSGACAWGGLPGFRMNRRLHAVLPLAMAHHAFPDRGYGPAVKAALPSFRSRAEFYHVSRGQPLAALDPRVRGDEYRDDFWAQTHAEWFGAYWVLQRLDV